MVWVDLKPLLSEGRLDLDIRLARNDVVYLPDANDQFGLMFSGYVKQPGAMHLTPAMSFLDAVALAGGPTPDANLSHVSLIRNSKGKHEEIPLKDFFEGRSRPNLALEDGGPDLCSSAMDGSLRILYGKSKSADHICSLGSLGSHENRDARLKPQKKNRDAEFYLDSNLPPGGWATVPGYPGAGNVDALDVPWQLVLDRHRLL